MATEDKQTLAQANPDRYNNSVEPKLFGRYDMENLICAEISLVDYIKNTPARFSSSNGIYVPHTAGRYCMSD